ncbi:MAG: FAD-dependent oxidoreductase [Alphaproteobacteria bacterium]
MGARELGVSRRAVLTGAAAGTAAATLGAITLSTNSARAEQTWNRETDILVVGAGSAGLTAAVIASSNGDNVIVVEKAAEPGGTCAKSGGVFWIPNHFALKAKGIEDKKDDCLRFLSRYSFPEDYTPDSPTLGLTPEAYSLLEAFYDNGSVMVDQVQDLGALKIMHWDMWHMKRMPPDYFDHAPENMTSMGRPLSPALPDGNAGNGTEIIGQMGDWLADKGVPVLLEHPAKNLLMDEAGAVIGLQTEHDGKDVAIHARKAVIFATGGFAHNPDLLQRYQRNVVYGSCGAAVATGDLIPIASAAGAKLGNMTGAWRTEVVLEETLENREVGSGAFMPPGDSMMQVNKYGHRVVNEKRNYNDRTEIHHVFDPSRAEYPNQLLFTIYDQRTAEAYADNYPLPAKPTNAPYIVSGETLDELAAALAARLEELGPKIGKISLDADFATSLKATFARFNDYARTGVDPDFGRGAQEYDRAWTHLFAPQKVSDQWPANDMPNITMYPIRNEGPYYAYIVGAGVLDTNGGPVINAKAQILDQDDQPIPGLYGAGNCIASPSREAYFGAGGTIGLAMTYGYIAANNAHNEPVKDS